MSAERERGAEGQEKHRSVTDLGSWGLLEAERAKRGVAIIPAKALTPDMAPRKANHATVARMVPRKLVDELVCRGTLMSEADFFSRWTFLDADAQ